MPPDQKKLLDTYYDSERGRLASYQLEVSLSNYLKLDIVKLGNTLARKAPVLDSLYFNFCSCIIGRRSSYSIDHEHMPGSLRCTRFF